MKTNRISARLLALCLAVLMLTAQAVLPCAALALSAAELPLVTVTVQTGEGEAAFPAACTDVGDSCAYWVQVPYDAVIDSVRVTVDGSAMGDQEVPVTGAAVSFDGISCAWIQLYDGETFVDAVPLYVSYDPMPSPEEEPVIPQEPTPAWVSVQYLDANTGSELASDGAEYTEGYYEIWPDAGKLPQGYTLADGNPVSVSVSFDGTASPASVTFWAVPEAAATEEPWEPEPTEEPWVPQEPTPAWIAILYLDANNGSELASDGAEYTEGNYEIWPDAGKLPQGYTLADGSPVSVNVSFDGTASPATVTFWAVAEAVATEEPWEPEPTEEPWIPDEPIEDPRVPAEPTEEPDPDAGYTILEEINAYGETNTKDVNFRKQPNTQAKKAATAARAGTQVFVYRRVMGTGGKNEFYSVDYNGIRCYVKADLIRLAGAEPTEEPWEPEPTEEPWVPAEPTEEPWVPAEPTEVPGPQYTVLEEINRYGATNTTGVNFRKEPNTQAKKAATANMTGTSVWVYSRVMGTGGQNEFYFVNYNGTDCYVKSNLIDLQRYAAEVSVTYIDADTGAQVYAGSVSAEEGTSQIVPDASLVPGYELQSTEPVTVTVTGEGEANPSKAVFYVTAIPVLPAEADVTVSYIDSAYTLITTASVHVTEGENTVWPDASLVPGYELDSTAPVTVTLSKDGTLTPAEVEFTVTPLPPAEKDVTVSYIDSAYTLIASASVHVTEGENTVWPDASLVPGYVLDSNAPVTVTLSGDGTLTPAEVEFTVTPLPPTEAEVNVTYIDSAYTVIAAASVHVTEGENVIRPDVHLVPGYVLDSDAPVTVTLSKDGTLTPAEVEFTVTPLPPAEVSVTLYYVDAQGKTLKDAETVTLTEGGYDAASLMSAAPEGYDFAGASPASLTVTREGIVSPSSAVTFIFMEKPAVTASVEFRYVCGSKKIADPAIVSLEEGGHDVYEYFVEAEGYKLASVSAETVTVSADGAADPAQVTFTYEQIKKTVDFRVVYVSPIGEPLNEETVELKPGTHTVAPNADLVPDGYVLSSSARPVTVTVARDFTAAPAMVTFSCYPEATEGTLTIQYFDSTTNVRISTENRSLKPGEYDVEPNDAIVAAAGKYDRSDIVVDSRVNVSEAGVVVPAVLNFYYQPAEIDIYQGYLMTTRRTDMRSSVTNSASAVASLPADTLLWTAGQYQSGGLTWHSAQTVLGSSVNGWVNDADTRRVSAQEAQALIEQAQKEQGPRQDPGYYITIVNNAPLRVFPNPYASADFLNLNTVVYVFSQEYGPADNYVWHRASYNGSYGYIREGQIRKMTEAEVIAYQQGHSNPTPPSATEAPYDPASGSSYGYVNASSVNFRSSPSGSATRLGVISRYGMALILDSRDVNGKTWYNINYNGTTGWVHGDYFHQMSLSEFSSFVGSNKYYQGITNNSSSSSGSSSGSSSQSSSGSSTQGSVATVEDWNVGTWQNTGAAVTATYAPFNPYATPAPTATADPNATADPSAAETAEPEATFVIGTMIPIDYGDPEEENTGMSLGAILGIAAGIIVVGGAGGAYAYTASRAKRRKAAAARAAAANRVTSAPSASSAASGSHTVTAAPSAASAAAAGAYQRPAQSQSAGSTPYSASSQSGAANPYSAPVRPASANPYSAPAQSSTANPYAATSGSTANPYSAPVQSSTANPYAATSSSTANPYSAPAQSAPVAPAANPYASAGYSSGTQQNSFFSDDQEAPAANPYAAPSGEPRARTRARHSSADGNGTGI